MLSLDVTLLKTNNLSDLIQSNWYATELARWQAEAEKFDAESYKAANQLTWQQTVQNVEALLEDQAYIEAAICLQVGCGAERTPLIKAIQFNEVNLVMACLALGNKVNESVWGEDRFPLTEAMMVNNVDMFNLLLLAPNINVNVEAEVRSEFDDISQFLGMGQQFEYYRPVETLLSAAYSPILASLSIDTEKRYGPQRVPLMVHAYLHNNIRLMNWLVFCGAEINPYLDGYSDAGPNLLNLALYDYLTYKDERHAQLLKWFSRFAKLWTAPSELSPSLLADLIDSAERGAPELDDWFNLQPMLESKLDSEEEFARLSEQCEELQGQLSEEKQKITALARTPRQKQKSTSEELRTVSLLEELQRVHRVVVSELLEDILVQVSESAIWFGFAYDGDLICIEVQSPDVHEFHDLVCAQELLGYSEFQLMLYFLSLSERFWFKLSLMAEQQDIYPFQSIDGNYLVSQRVAEAFLQQASQGKFAHLDRYEWQVLHKNLDTLATEADLLTGKHDLCLFVEDICRHRIYNAPCNPDYFAELETRTNKAVERKVFGNLQLMFEQLLSGSDSRNG